MSENKGMTCTIKNLTIHKKIGNMFELRFQASRTHYLHCALGLDDCRIVRNEMLGWNMDNALIEDDGEYYRVSFLWHTEILIPSELELRFHSEKLNLASAVALYDRITKNDS